MADESLPGPAVVTEDMRLSLNVPYAAGAKADAGSRQALDVYAPREGSELPVIAYVHGGGWKYWDRKGVDLKPAAFTKLGFVFVSIGYRLVPEVRYREQCMDVARGLRWIRDHIAEFGGSSERIHLMGFSAGAPMVALTLCDPQYLRAADVPISAICSATGLDGDCYYIPQQIRMTDAKTREYHESVWGSEASGWEDPSPLTHLRPGRAYPPFLVTYVSSRPDSTWQAKAFGERYGAVGGKAQLLPVETTHLRMNKEIGREGDATTAAFLEFVERHDCAAVG